MKKFKCIGIICFIASMLIMQSGCPQLQQGFEVVQSVPVEKVEITPSELELHPGDYERLVAIVYPENASNREIVWTCVPDNSNITLSNSKDGTANIYVKEADSSFTVYVTATAKEGKCSATCTVTVTPKKEEISGDDNEKPDDGNTGDDNETEKPNDSNSSDDNETGKPNDGNSGDDNETEKPNDANASDNETGKPDDGNNDDSNETEKPNDSNSSDNNETEKPNDGNTGDDNETGKPNDGNADNDNETEKPNDANTGGDNETEKPNDANTGDNNETEKPNDGNSSGDNETEKPDDGNTGDDNETEKPDDSNVANTTNLGFKIEIENTSDIKGMSYSCDGDKATLTVPKGHSSYNWFLDDTLQFKYDNSYWLEIDTKTLAKGMHSVIVIINDVYSAGYTLSKYKN